MLLTVGDRDPEVRAAARLMIVCCTRDRARVTAQSGHPTQAAAQAAEIDRPALGEQRVHEGETTGDSRSGVQGKSYVPVSLL
jgi:anti-sigma factor RsiW